MATSRVTIVSGSGAHTDPWHDLDETSKALAGVLDGAPVVATDVLASLDGIDVVVVNVSGDLARDPAESTVVVDALADHVARGGGLVSVHSSALAFREDARWRALMGGRWVPGVSGHPQIGRALVQATGAHAALPADFVVYDERYSALEVEPDAAVAAVHTEDGLTHPLVWTIERTANRGRVAYSALGHGVEAYESPNADVVRALVAWAAPER